MEKAFYNKENLHPAMRDQGPGNTVEVPDDVDPELLAKVLANPKMLVLLLSLAKTMEKRDA